MPSEKRFLSPDTLAPPFGYSHVVEAPARRIVYVSGQVPLDSEGQLVGEGDFEAQARQVFANLTAALEAAGVAWSDVVKLNYFLADVSQIASVSRWASAARTATAWLVDSGRPN